MLRVAEQQFKGLHVQVPPPGHQQLKERTTWLVKDQIKSSNLDRPAHLVAPLVHALAGSRPAGAGPGLQGTGGVRGVLVGTHALPSK